MNIAAFASHGGSNLQAIIDGYHLSLKKYDSGEIIAQTKVEVLEKDTPELLARRVLEREHTFLVEVLKEIAEGKIQLG